MSLGAAMAELFTAILTAKDRAAQTKLAQDLAAEARHQVALEARIDAELARKRTGIFWVRPK